LQLTSLERFHLELKHFPSPLGGEIHELSVLSLWGYEEKAYAVYALEEKIMLVGII
jgi:hypothetical protein